MINIKIKRTILPVKIDELIFHKGNKLFEQLIIPQYHVFGYQQQFMAEQQLQELKEKLQQQQAEFQRYKAECKQLESFLQSQSTKKQEQIRKLKQQAILKEKSFGPLKAQVSQLQAENAKLKTQITQLKQQQEGSQQAALKNEEYAKQIEQMKSIISNLESEKEGLSSKISTLEAKTNEPQKGGKGKPDGDSKKLQDALSASKSKISELERQVEKLREQLTRKASVKDLKQQEKKVEKVDKQHKDNKQEQRLREKIEKLQKRLSESHSQTSRAQQKSIKLSKQLKQMKQKLAGLESDKQSLSRRLKQAMISNSQRKQQSHMRQEHEQNEQQVEQTKDQSSNQLFYSALMLTKKHYVSPFLQFKSDNSVKVFKSTKNGCFQKSLGSIKCKLNQVTYNPEELIQGCANRIKDNLARGVKCSVVLFGSKKTTKKYLLANLVAKLKDFIIEKISDSEQKPQAIFIKASPDPEKRLQLVGNHPDQVQQILDKIIEMAQKSPKKGEPKKKSQPKPKARYLKISHGSLYLQIITTSFTNIQLRQNQTIAEALNNIAYSRLPNALQPTDCFRQIILTLNPIVSLYDDCKNALSIANCKKSSGLEAGNDFELKNSPIKQELNDAARKKLQSIQRQIEQNNLKIRRQEEQITFYKSKFDQLELRLKNLLNTHREQNTYLKKSPVTLSYEKMLKFVHSVQSKNPSFTGSASKVQEHYGNHTMQENEDYDGLVQEREHDQVDGEAEDIL